MLIQLSASHISCKKRLDTLCRQLDSIRAQTIYAPFFLSISTIPELYTEASDRLEKYTDINIHFRPDKLSQFEHYALLAEFIDEDAWYIFCDDDDFCHPDRVKWYSENIELYNAYDTIFPVNGTMSIYKDGSLDMTLDDLFEYERKFPETVSHTAFEYWMFATRADIFKQFFEINKNNIKNKFCDIFFRNFLKTTNCKFIKSDTWLYAKTMDISFDHVSLDLLVSSLVLSSDKNLSK